MLKPIAIALTVIILTLGTIVTTTAAGRADTWAGKWFVANGPKVMDSKLTIEEIAPNGAVRGTFTWEAAPSWQVSAGSRTFKGKLDDDVLIWVWIGSQTGKEYKFSFTFNPDGSLSGGRYINGTQTSKVDMIKFPNPIIGD